MRDVGHTSTLKDSARGPTTPAMIEPTPAPVVDGARMLSRSAIAPAVKKPPGASETSFAGRLARLTATARPGGALEPAMRPDNEQTTKVAGHPYARIENGADKGMYLNQLDGSPRAGAVFTLVERDNRIFHVYGAGRDKLVVEVKAKDKPGAAARPTGGAAPTAA